MGAAGKPAYAEACAQFAWKDALDDLGWSGAAEVDLAWTVVGRHAAGPRADRTAVHWIGADGSERRLTFRDLDRQSAQFGNVLRRHGVRKGDRVATLLPRIPETVPAMLGVWRAGAILVPVFAGFGADAVDYRLRHSGAKAVLVARRYRHLVPAIAGLAVIEADSADVLIGADETMPRAFLSRDAAAAIIYTSGSTGQPKGCVIAANILAAMWPYVRYGLDLRPEADVFWPTGDPGWGYGLCCYMPALAAGATALSVEANATYDVCRDVIGRFKVSNLATTPTVLRSLMAQGEAVRDFGGSMRAISSCGEPLNGEVVEFFRRVWNVTPMDHFGATEFGLPVGNHNAVAMDVKPGSMGLPAPGQTMAVVGEDGEELPPETVGLIAQRCDGNTRYWLRYWNDEAASVALRRGDWTCTGDLARRDAGGYFWFEGRADDIIKSAGYRIGPFEIESAVLRHGAVAEAAAVGVPDPLRGQAIKVFVVTRPGVAPNDALASEFVELVRTVCGRHQAPREVAFVDALPKTQTGKIQRFLLRRAGEAKEEKP
ncbi:MAG: acyl-CoA synthetase [Alphaproteobacteria bacterium]|nr:acyl-CoA synthetase [Alphaproteobacteria bacterium]